MPGGSNIETIGEDNKPQMSGYGGVSGAPVEVQEAARRLYKQVFPETSSPAPSPVPTPTPPPSPPTDNFLG